MCWNHYQRHRRGAPVYVYLAPSGPTGLRRAVKFGPAPLPGWKPPRRVCVCPPLADRYWERVDTRGPELPHMDSRCWAWVGGRINGRPYLRAGGRGTQQLPAIRAAWKVHTGNDAPPGLRNRCGNRDCTRPEHFDPRP
jgi:hypothetical protein